MNAAVLPTASATPAALDLPDQRVLAVDGLTVSFATSERTVNAVRNLSFHVDRGETLAIVGESGSGKSVTSLSLMRLVEHGGGRIVGGRMALPRAATAACSTSRRPPTPRCARIRGAEIAMIFQEPMTSLNPVFTVGDQIAEAIAHPPGQGPRGRARRGAAHAGAGAHSRGAQRARRAIRTSSRAACASA